MYVGLVGGCSGGGFHGRRWDEPQVSESPPTRSLTTEKEDSSPSCPSNRVQFTVKDAVVTTEAAAKQLPMNDEMFCSLVERLDEGAKKMEARWDKMQETLDAILRQLSEPCQGCHRTRNGQHPHPQPATADANGSVSEAGPAKVSRRTKQRQRQRQRQHEKEQLASSGEAKLNDEGSASHVNGAAPVTAHAGSPSASERKRNLDDDDDDGCDSYDPSSKRMRSEGGAEDDADGDEL